MDKVLVSIIGVIQRENPADSDKVNVKVDSLMKLIKDDMNKVTSDHLSVHSR